MKAFGLKQTRKKRRRKSVRRRLQRGARTVRLSVHRTLKHTYAQVIDDAAGKTLCGIGTTAEAVASAVKGKSKAEKAAYVGAEIARLAREKGVEQVIFDRGDCKFHGRVKALAEAAREGGLKF